MDRRTYLAVGAAALLAGCLSRFGPSDVEREQAVESALTETAESDRVTVSDYLMVSASANDEGMEVTVRYRLPYDESDDPAEVEAVSLENVPPLMETLEEADEDFRIVTIHSMVHEADGEGFRFVTDARFEGQVLEEYDWETVDPEAVPEIAYDYQAHLEDVFG